MTGYVVIDWWSDIAPFSCEREERVNNYDFWVCADHCDTAIDDYQDVSNYADASVQCLKLCMWE